MLPADQYCPTPTEGMQVLQLSNEDPAQSSGRVSAPNSDGRKRRRITPIASAPVPALLTRDLDLESAGPNLALDDTASTAPETWDYLAKWQAAGDSIAEYSEEEEDEYYSDVSYASPGAVEDPGHGSGEEDSLPPEGPAMRPSKLSTAQVTDIINSCIEMYTNAWRPGKGEKKYKNEEGETEVPVVYDTFALWEEAEAAGQREELAKRYELEAEHYRQRLDRLCEEISKDPGDNTAGVKKKCRNLEVTVEQLERANWFASIYELSPVADSDESENEKFVNLNGAHLAALQGPSIVQKGNTLPQVIHLGSPSGSSSASGEDEEPSSGIPQIPARTHYDNQREQCTHACSWVSSPAVIDTIETSGPVVEPAILNTARSQVPLGDAPEHASIATVSRWDWHQLEDAQDRKRIVSKAICDLSSTEREVIRRRLQKVGRANMIREIPACISMLMCGDTRMPGILPQDLPKIVTFTRLFLCWWLCGNYFKNEVSAERLEELANCLRQNSPDPATFCDYVGTVLSTTFSRAALSNPTRPSQAEIIEISDDDEPLVQVSKRPNSNINQPRNSHRSPAIVLE